MIGFVMYFNTEMIGFVMYFNQECNFLRIDKRVSDVDRR